MKVRILVEALAHSHSFSILAAPHRMRHPCYSHWWMTHGHGWRPTQTFRKPPNILGQTVHSFVMRRTHENPSHMWSSTVLPSTIPKSCHAFVHFSSHPINQSPYGCGSRDLCLFPNMTPVASRAVGMFSHFLDRWIWPSSPYHLVYPLFLLVLITAYSLSNLSTIKFHQWMVGGLNHPYIGPPTTPPCLALRTPARGGMLGQRSTNWKKPIWWPSKYHYC